jgi:hypothetical protein
LNETTALQAFIDAANADEIADVLEYKTLSDRIAKLEAVIFPPYDPKIQWRTGMESGDLSAWSEQVNTGFAASSAVQLVLEGIIPHLSKPSLWAMKQVVNAPSNTAEASGTRISRYPEINALCKAGTPFYYSWWDFFPIGMSYGAGGWYNHWQIASHDGTPGGYYPIWVLGINGSGMTTSLTWSPNNKAPAEGPHVGETGSRTYTSAIAVPVGQWVFFEAMVKPASDFTGALKMWVNGQVLYDLPSIKTQFPFSTQPTLAWIANNCYGVGFAMPFAHYVDDVSLSLGRMS